MDDCIIKESYTLPSLGKVYDKAINPNVTIRSMTTNEEMKRLGKSDSSYKLLTEIIDDCLLEPKPGISVYDMCIGDYQFLLHKLRIVTYGSNYKMDSRCPICGALNKHEINLEDLKVTQYSDDMIKHLNITLPRAKKQIELRLQTPRMLDEIQNRSRDLLKKAPSTKGEPAFLFTLESMIAKVDGQVLDPVTLSQFVRTLNAYDANYILKNIEKVNIGIEPMIDCKCEVCGGEYLCPFPYSSEFFGPSID